MPRPPPPLFTLFISDGLYSRRRALVRSGGKGSQRRCRGSAVRRRRRGHAPRAARALPGKRGCATDDPPRSLGARPDTPRGNRRRPQRQDHDAHPRAGDIRQLHDLEFRDRGRARSPPGLRAPRRELSPYGLVRTTAFGRSRPGPTLYEPPMYIAAVPPPSRLRASRAPSACITYAASETVALVTIAR